MRMVFVLSLALDYVLHIVSNPHIIKITTSKLGEDCRDRVYMLCIEPLRPLQVRDGHGKQICTQ